MDNTTKNILTVFLVVLSFYLLSVLQGILIPLVLAFLFASLFQPFILFLKRKNFPKFLILPFIAIITLGIFFAIFQIILQTSSEISAQSDFLLNSLNDKFNAIVAWLNQVAKQYFNSRVTIRSIKSIFTTERVSFIAGNLASTIGSFTGSFFMFALYYIVLLSSLSEYKKFIPHVAGEKNKKKFLDYYEIIQKSIVSYISIKTFLCILTGVLTYIICVFFGLKFAFLWGFLAFLFYYIPTIGPIISEIPPLLMAIIQFDSINPIIFLFLSLIVLYTIMGNILEPVIMGNRLKLNTLTVIFGLIFWGYLWGISGMIISVPLLVMLKLVFEHFPALRGISRLMGTPEPERKMKL